MRRAIIRPRAAAQGKAGTPPPSSQTATPAPATPAPATPGPAPQRPSGAAPTEGALALQSAPRQNAPGQSAPGQGASRRSAPPSPSQGASQVPPPIPPEQPPRFSGRSGYSLFVFLLKVLLPALAAALILLVIVWPQLLPTESLMKVPAMELSLDQANRLSMLNPRFDGIDSQNRPFTITADEAIQDRDNEDLVDLRVPKADMVMEDGTWLAVMARNGLYHRENETVDLQGDVVLFHDEGFEMKTEFAHVDLNAGTAEGDEPVAGQGPAGTLTAEGFRVEEKGERIIFTGKSHMVMYQ